MTTEGDSWAERVRWIVQRFGGGNHAVVGRKINTRSATVSQWTRGGAVPSGDVLSALLRAYPLVNPDYLLTGTGPQERKYRPLAGPTAAQKALDEIKDVLDRAGKSERPASEPETDAELSAKTQKALDRPVRGTPRTAPKKKDRRSSGDPRPNDGDSDNS